MELERPPDLAPELHGPRIFQMLGAADHPQIVQRLLVLAEQCSGDLGDAITKREGKGVRPAGIVP